MGHIMMSEKEQKRASLFEMVKQKQITLVQAAKQAEISYRQAKRLYGRYCTAGAAGIVHRRRGMPSNRRHPEREQIMVRYRERYEGFGPTLAAEKLSEEDGFQIDHDTLRK